MYARLLVAREPGEVSRKSHFWCSNTKIDVGFEVGGLRDVVGVVSHRNDSVRDGDDSESSADWPSRWSGPDSVETGMEVGGNTSNCIGIKPVKLRELGGGVST